MTAKWSVVAFAAAVGAASGIARADQIPDRATLQALLGGNGVLEDFETLDIPFGGQRTDGSGLLNSTTFFDGSGPGLVKPGVDYVSPRLWWNGDGYFNLKTKTLADSSGWRGFEITIRFTTDVNAMGFDMQGYQGFPMGGTVSVYDRGGGLLGVANVNGGFFGWEHAAGIGHIVVSATDGYIMIDDHLYGLAGKACYPDCDQNGRLDIRDFFCFQAAFAARDPYADCDKNNVFDIRDFFCFQGEYANGCR